MQSCLFTTLWWPLKHYSGMLHSLDDTTHTCQCTGILPPSLLEQTVSTRILLLMALSCSSLYCPLAQEITGNLSCSSLSQNHTVLPGNSNKPSKEDNLYPGNHISRITGNTSLCPLHLVSSHTLVGDTASMLWMLFGTEDSTRRKKKTEKVRKPTSSFK